jgi:transcriptional regulator with XRE-family HTH domain
VRARRLDRGLTQAQLAELLEVTESTINNWERGRSSPDLRALPRVLLWLDYDPRPQAEQLGQQVTAARRAQGLSQREFAEALGADPSTVSAWETGRAQPSPRYAELLTIFNRGGEDG